MRRPKAFAKALAQAYFQAMDAVPTPRLHLDEVIAANRSLPRQGFIILICVVMALNLIVGTMFLMMGAWPAPVFLGLDVVAIWYAFRVSNRQARTCERVQVTSDHVRVLREVGASSQTIWTSPTAFTRVALEQSGRYGAEVRLMLSAKRLTIGAMLGPRQRAELAKAVDQAIRSARAERHEP